MSPALAAALEKRASDSYVRAATYREILVSRALNFSSDRMDQISVPLKMSPGSEDVLMDLVSQLGPEDFTVEEKGLSVRLPIKLDEPLAQRIEETAERIGVSASQYLRAIFRIAVGSDIKAFGTQEKFELEHSVREGDRLAS